MFELKIKNSTNGIITLTQNESNYVVTNVDGLNPPKAEITTTQVANYDGAKYKSGRLEMRNIVITVRLRGDIETNRNDLYHYVNTNEKVTIFYKNGLKNVCIDGYIETVESNFFTTSEQVQLSIICPEPYFKFCQEIAKDISKSIGNFQFPFAIEEEGVEFEVFNTDRQTVVFNSGEVETGFIMNISSSVNGIEQIRVIDRLTQEVMEFNIELNANDELIVDTNVGHKSVKKISGEVVTNEINSLSVDSDWLKLRKGNNVFSYDVTPEINQIDVRVVFNYYIKYKGV